MLDKKEVIERLCLLSSIVAEDHFNWGLGADCICKHVRADSFRYEREVMEFIEGAVHEKLKASKTDDKPKFKYVVEKASEYDTPTGLYSDSETLYKFDTPEEAHSMCVALEAKGVDYGVAYQVYVDLVEDE